MTDYRSKRFDAMTADGARIAELERELELARAGNRINVHFDDARIAALEEAADGVVAWLRAGASRDADSLAVLEGHVWKLAPLVSDRQNTAQSDRQDVKE